MEMFNTYVLENELGMIETKQSFKNLTTIGCGGDIEVVYYPNSISSLSKAYAYIMAHHLKYVVLGNGSNVLASDRYYKGIVICLKQMPYSMQIEDDYIEASAFYPSIRFAYDLAEKELGDFSFLGGIPGLLGGAIWSNSGAYNEDISEKIISVDYIDTSGNIQTLNKEECRFEYRKSIFHYLEGIIICVKLKYHKENTDMKLIDRKKRRQLSQPLNVKSMGSIFKNNPLIPSWEIIDALNLRGFSIGGAAVSCKHTNFIINMGNATTSDVLALIDLIKTRTRLELGIELSCEIMVLD